MTEIKGGEKVHVEFDATVVETDWDFNTIKDDRVGVVLPGSGVAYVPIDAVTITAPRPYRQGDLVKCGVDREPEPYTTLLFEDTGEVIRRDGDHWVFAIKGNHKFLWRNMSRGEARVIWVPEAGE